MFYIENTTRTHKKTFLYFYSCSKPIGFIGISSGPSVKAKTDNEKQGVKANNKEIVLFNKLFMWVLINWLRLKDKKKVTPCKEKEQLNV